MFFMEILAVAVGCAIYKGLTFSGSAILEKVKEWAANRAAAANVPYLLLPKLAAVASKLGDHPSPTNRFNDCKIKDCPVCEYHSWEGSGSNATFSKRRESFNSAMRDVTNLLPPA
jgi:hypothetical protein